MKEIIKINIDKLIKVLLVTKKETQQINKIANILITAIKKGKKYLFMEMVVHLLIVHILGELTATYKKKAPLPFFLLGSNMASVSAWANDYKTINIYLEN